MNRRKWMMLTAGTAILLLLAGCGGNNDAANNEENNNNGGNVAAADAESIYKQNCVACHGADLKGQNLATVGSRLSKEQIEEKIRKGGGGMIAFESKLNDAEITALTDWLAEKK